MPKYTVQGMREQHVKVTFEAADDAAARAMIDVFHNQLKTPENALITVLQTLPEIYGVVTHTEWLNEDL